ncbi:MAG: YceI family protein [Pyrinomonadaceae bacterium]|nr:YceI family protein [Sphingobacteriaceae bacterium]
MLPNLPVLLFILLSALSSQVSKPQITKWVVMKGGSLKVDGSTNINKFNCAISNYAKSDTIIINKLPAKGVISLSGEIILEVQNFDCHNPVMTSDLRKTLKAKAFPKLTVSFLSLSKYPSLSSRNELIKGMVAIELSGVNKKFEVNYKVISLGENVINLIGTREVNFSDFNIIPPRKIGGMIRTNNELNVEFNLRLKILN